MMATLILKVAISREKWFSERVETRSTAALLQHLGHNAVGQLNMGWAHALHGYLVASAYNKQEPP